MGEPQRATDDVADLVVATANRLRLIQADLSDESEDVRQQYLTDELERALASLVPAERTGFLDALAACFPTWDSLVQRTDPGGDPATAPTDLDDALALAERLAALAPGLPEDQRRAVAGRLRDAGLSAEGRAAWPEQAAAGLAARLGLEDSQPLDPARSVDALRIAIDCLLGLDQLMWATWRTLAPRSDLRGQGELAGSLTRFLAGDPDVPRGEVAAHVERMRQLTAALVSAVGQAGRQFAERHHERFAPEHVEEWARQDKKALESLAVACWRRYCALAGERDPATIEHEIQQQIAEAAEQLMRGVAR